jgi:hypothetical protein
MATTRSYQEALEEVVQQAVAPDAAAVDAGTCPGQAMDALRGVGLLGLASSVEVGDQGRGGGFEEAAAAAERVARSCGLPLFRDGRPAGRRRRRLLAEGGSHPGGPAPPGAAGARRLCGAVRGDRRSRGSRTRVARMT